MYGQSKKSLAFWSSCFLLFLLPISANSANQPQPQSKTENKPTAYDQRGTQESPLVIQGNITTKATEKSESERQQEDIKIEIERSLAKYTGITAGVTGALVAVTAVLAAFTYFLWKSTGKLVEGANNAEAAYILPHITRHSGFFEGPPLFPRPRIQYGFKNHGKTLAIIRRWRDVTTDMLPPNPIFKEPWERRQVHYIPVIGEELAGEVWAQIPDGMSAEKALAFMNEGRWLYIVGEVEYEDIFGVVRIQGYCLRIMDVTPKGWRVWRDGGLAYNYRRKVD